MKRKIVLLAALLVALPVLIWLVFSPMRRDLGTVSSHPATSYAESLRRVLELWKAEGSGINPVCKTRLLSHGFKTERVFVLLHGFTNCPRQFEQLGQELCDSGANVFIPRQPRHGLADKMTTELRDLTAEELARAGEEAVDIARGLGARVTVVGLSSSAVVAGWLAQHRGDIDEAVLIAPSYSPKGFSLEANRRLTSLLLAMPSAFIWWDPKLKTKVPGPTNCYPGFPTRGLAQVYRLGLISMDEAAREPPRAREIQIVTTAVDEGVDHNAPIELAKRWRAHGGNVRAYEFPAALGVRHDMIDPLQPYQRVDLVYPKLIQLLEPSREDRIPSGVAAPEGAR